MFLKLQHALICCPQWGGWGANPLPNRFEGLWLQTEGHVLGGMPYSEGMPTRFLVCLHAEDT